MAKSLLEERSAEDIVAWLLEREARQSPVTPSEIRDDRKAPDRQQRKPRKVEPRSRSQQRPKGDFVTYQVSWGAHAGADTRRLLAMVCRRGDVSSDVVGAIRVAPRSSTVDIASSAAQRFERSVTRPDKRNPRARFRRWDPPAAKRRSIL